MSYHTEFPDYDGVPLMAQWKGRSTWFDVSWHNDVMPSYQSDDLIPGYLVRVWSDYAIESMREVPDLGRYTLTLYTGDDEWLVDLIRTDSADEVEHLVSRLEACNPVFDGESGNGNHKGGTRSSLRRQ